MQACSIYTIPPFHTQFALQLACCWEHEQQFSFIYNFLTPLPPSRTLPVTWLMTTLPVMDTWFCVLQVSSVLISLHTAAVKRTTQLNRGSFESKHNYLMLLYHWYDEWWRDLIEF